jgi:hypothetical protein
VGIEPTRPSYQDGRLPLHHKGVDGSQFRIPQSEIRIRKSAQWESNPHVRHGKAIGYRYIMGAVAQFKVQNEKFKVTISARLPSTLHFSFFPLH